MFFVGTTFLDVLILYLKLQRSLVQNLVGGSEFFHFLSPYTNIITLLLLFSLVQIFLLFLKKSFPSLIVSKISVGLSPYAFIIANRERVSLVQNGSVFFYWQCKCFSISLLVGFSLVQVLQGICVMIGTPKTTSLLTSGDSVSLIQIVHFW